MEDQQIIDLYLARDERAIAETDKKYGAFCMSISLDILKDPQDAEECLNDTWLNVWNHIPPDIPHRLRTYLGYIVRMLSIDRYRFNHAERRNKDMEVALDELENCVAVQDGSADEGRLRADINTFLRSLSKTDRVIFILRYYHAKPVKDVADAVGMTANAATKRLKKTRESLRAYLNERGYGL